MCNYDVKVTVEKAVSTEASLVDAIDVTFGGPPSKYFGTDGAVRAQCGADFRGRLMELRTLPGIVHVRQLEERRAGAVGRIEKLEAEIAKIRSSFATKVLDEEEADKASAAITAATQKIASVRLELESIDCALPKVVAARDTELQSQANGIGEQVIRQLVAEEESARRALWEATKDALYEALLAESKMREAIRLMYHESADSLARRVLWWIKNASEDGESTTG